MQKNKPLKYKTFKDYWKSYEVRIIARLFRVLNSCSYRDSNILLQ